MKRQWKQAAAIGACWIAMLISGSSAVGATSFSNSLTGFTGDSTQPATQSAVAAAGFSFASITGLDAEFTEDPTVVLDSTGAHFGTLFSGDGGRNYMRTIQSDYATVPFVAEITLTIGEAGAPPLQNQQPFFGMGTGDRALFGVPDWSTLFASTFVSPEVDSTLNPLLTTFRTQNDANQFVNNPAPGFGAGTHRIQMTFSPVAKTMVYALDLNYAGGAFSANITAPAVDLNHIDCPSGCGNPTMPISADFFGPDGWPNEPSRIYWGGDDQVAFKDFSVTVSELPGLNGDYNDDGAVNAADYVQWRNGGPLQNESASIGVTDQADYNVWRSQFGQPGSGSGTASTVPEPTSIAILLGLIGCSVGLVRQRHC